MTLAEAMAAARAAVEADVARRLDGVDLPVAEAMLYAVKGGKCLRGFLALDSARLHGIAAERALPAAVAIECVHAYSLVHDDLPSMDDDDLRRGQPTVHRKWDEATAVLAGDALQALAFEALAETGSIPLIVGLARAAGVRGMVGGQALDIAAETAAVPLTFDQIVLLQGLKTGALIGWAATVGPTLAGADLLPLETYGKWLGQAFQIADDILDVTGDAAVVGKATGKDAAAGKATFVSLLGLDEARRRTAELSHWATAALDPYGNDADMLRDLARFVVARKA